MKNQIFNAFDQIRAEDALIEKTLEGMYSYTEKRERRAFFSQRSLAWILSCTLVLGVGLTSVYSYFTQAFALTVDVNPSIEMTVNCFDRVISVKVFNEEGCEIISAVNVKHMNYADAVDCLLEEEKACGYLEEEGTVLVAVACPKKEKADQVQDCIDTMQAEKPQTVEVIQPKKVAVIEAKKEDMSFGKYQAYLDIHEVAPDVTIEAVKEMSVQDIKTIITGETEAHSGTLTDTSVTPNTPVSTETTDKAVESSADKKPADTEIKLNENSADKKPADTSVKTTENSVDKKPVPADNKLNENSIDKKPADTVDKIPAAAPAATPVVENADKTINEETVVP